MRNANSADLNRLQDAVLRLAGKRIVVVGDVMLDRYVWGTVDRVSPEAPVPVLLVTKDESRPGGAANVARNVAALGGHATLIGLVGTDEGARLMEGLCHADGIETAFVADAMPTIEKTRFIAQGQQLLRADREERPHAHPVAEQAVCAAIEKATRDCDAVLLSDYAKGAVTPAVADALRTCGKPVIVDPKPAHGPLYKGLFMMTPNHREAALLAGTDAATHPPREAAANMLGRLTQHILVTCGARGMYLATADGREYELPSRARAVYDVTGAGDTVLATLGLAVAAGLSLPDAAALANHAAGIVVGKVGTETVRPDELRADLETRAP